MNRFERNIGVTMSRLRGVKRTAALVAVVALSLPQPPTTSMLPAREGRLCRRRNRRVRPAGCLPSCLSLRLIVPLLVSPKNTI